jgi:single-strand DNA-binding protein
MSSLNRAFVLGRLGQDPQARFLDSGQVVVNLSIATDESYKGKDGQKVEKTEWHKVVLWGKPAEFAKQYLTKGRLVYVEGKLETRKWTDKDGNERYTTEIKGNSIQALDKAPEAKESGVQRPVMNEMDDAPF